MHDRLPLFPLGLVLFPGEPVPLHIFEPRYKEMVRVCLDADRPFGIVYASEDRLAEVGCTARIQRVVTRYEDGRADIIAVGEERFRIERVHRDRPFLTGDVTPVEDVTAPPPVLPIRERVIARHMKMIELAGETVRPGLYDAAGTMTSFVVARRAGLDLDDRQRLLEMTSEPDRLEALDTHLVDLLRRVQRARNVQTLARGDGHTGDLPDLDVPDPDA